MGGIIKHMKAAKKYAIDPELRRYAIGMPFSPVILRMARPAMKAMYTMTAIGRNVEHRRLNTGGVRLDIFEPSACTERTPCLLYLHGGGFGYMAAPYHKQTAADYARGVGCRVICPDYRLLPRHPYPAAAEDCRSALEWVRERYPHAPIGLAGDSAGAALAATLAMDVSAAVRCLLLVYPVCDDACQTPSMAAFDDTPLWNSKNNAIMWQLYLEGRQGDAATAAAVPARCAIPPDMPPTYIELCEFDCLHDEGASFAARLADCGVAVDLNDTRGTYHGYDIARVASVTQNNISRRIDFLRRELNDQGLS